MTVASWGAFLTYSFPLTERPDLRSAVGFSRRCVACSFSLPRVQQPFVDFGIFCYLESLRIYSCSVAVCKPACFSSHFTISSKKKPGGVLKTSLDTPSANCPSLSLMTPAFHQLQDSVADALPPLRRTPSSIPSDMFPTSSRALTGGGLRAEAATNRLLTGSLAFSSCSSYPPHPPILQAGFLRAVLGPAPTVCGQPRAGDTVMGKGSGWCVAGCACWFGGWGCTQKRTGISCL